MSATTNTAAAMELRHVDPGTLVLIRNVRSDARPDPKLVASIKQHGLLQPITARDCADGLVVLYGHRRTLAAIEAGRATVPVLVLTDTDSDEAGRIITQLGENDHRDAVTDTDRATAYAQLALVGLTATQIARKTGRPVAEVKAGTTVAASAAAQDAEKFILAAAMLNGIESAPYGERNTLTASEKTAQGALRGLVWRILTQWHSSTGRHSWRQPRPIDALCIQHMTRWGYTASDVEQLLASK